MLSRVAEYEAKVYFLGDGSFNGIHTTEVHYGWIFMILSGNEKYYGKVIEDDYGFFITENEIYESQKYQKEFIAYSGVAISDDTIQKQMEYKWKQCIELVGGCYFGNEFKIYYFSEKTLLQKEINDIGKRWEKLLDQYING